MAGIIWLGAVHREFGIREQCLGICAIAGADGDADAGTQAKSLNSSRLSMPGTR
jgi:hypothetical protein